MNATSRDKRDTPEQRGHSLTTLVVIPVVALVLVVGLVSCGNSGSEASPAGSNVSADSELASGAGGANSSPGVTDTEIRFASFGTRSNNPLGTCVADCFDAGIKAYFDWRNSEGGVHGRHLVLTEQLDDQLAQNQQQALEIVSSNDVFGAFSAAVVANGWKELEQAGIPLYTWAINFNEMNGQHGIFGNVALTCVGCVDRWVPYVATQAKATKVASLGYGISQNSKDCADSNRKSVEKYADKTGQTAAYTNDNLDFGLPNGVAPEVTAMKDAGVDFVATCLDLNGVKTLETEMARQGIGDVPVFHVNTYDENFVKSAGDLFEGDYVGVAFRPYEAEAGDSQLNTFKEWMDKAGQPLTELAMNGWINADLAYQGIKAAGPSFTRQSVIDATNKLTAYTAGGLIAPIDWSRQHEFPTDEDPVTHGYAKECRSLVRIKSQRFELVGDKDKPFLCFDPKDQAWTQPTNMNVE